MSQSFHRFERRKGTAGFAPAIVLFCVVTGVVVAVARERIDDFVIGASAAFVALLADWYIRWLSHRSQTVQNASSGGKNTSD